MAGAGKILPELEEKSKLKETLQVMYNNVEINLQTCHAILRTGTGVILSECRSHVPKDFVQPSPSTHHKQIWHCTSDTRSKGSDQGT